MPLPRASKPSAWRRRPDKGDGIVSLCAEDLSYSHSTGAIDTKASPDGRASPRRTTSGYSLEYKNPTIKVVGPAAIVRFNFVGEQEFADGKKTPQNLAILMNWQKQGNDWKLLSRAASEPSCRLRHRFS